MRHSDLALRMATAHVLVVLPLACSLNTAGGGDGSELSAGGAVIDAGPDVQPDASFGGTLVGGSANGGNGNGGNGGSANGGSSSGGSANTAECGNGIREAGEQCDDGGKESGDGCSALCEAECPAGSSLGANFHCYWFNQEEKNWNDARNDCAAQKGYLVTITTPQESELLTGLVQVTAWIGATDGRTPSTAGAGSYAWVSGEAWGFTNWNANEPNAGDKGCGLFGRCYEHCATIAADGKWNDRYCEDDELPYICERVPPGAN